MALSKKERSKAAAQGSILSKLRAQDDSQGLSTPKEQPVPQHTGKDSESTSAGTFPATPMAPSQPTSSGLLADKGSGPDSHVTASTSEPHASAPPDTPSSPLVPPHLAEPPDAHPEEPFEQPHAPMTAPSAEPPLGLPTGPASSPSDEPLSSMPPDPHDDPAGPTDVPPSLDPSVVLGSSTQADAHADISASDDATVPVPLVPDVPPCTSNSLPDNAATSESPPVATPVAPDVASPPASTAPVSDASPVAADLPSTPSPNAPASDAMEVVDVSLSTVPTSVSDIVPDHVAPSDAARRSTTPTAVGDMPDDPDHEPHGDPQSDRKTYVLYDEHIQMLDTLKRHGIPKEVAVGSAIDYMDYEVKAGTWIEPAMSTNVSPPSNLPSNPALRRVVERHREVVARPVGKKKTYKVTPEQRRILARLAAERDTDYSEVLRAAIAAFFAAFMTELEDAGEGGGAE